MSEEQEEKKDGIEMLRINRQIYTSDHCCTKKMPFILGGCNSHYENIYLNLVKEQNKKDRTHICFVREGGGAIRGELEPIHPFVYHFLLT